jgi:FkbM family methyltransferase
MKTGIPMPEPGEKKFSYSGTELDSLAEAKNYYTWVMKQFEPFAGPQMIEVGAGIGTFSEFVLSVPRVERLVAIEPAENTFPHLEARFRANGRVEVRKGYLSDHRDSLSADALVAVNVLEHVPDDSAFLRDAFASVKQGGHLLLFVPALPAIFGTLDVAFEHHRRYTRTTLRAVIEGAGWKPLRISYMNMPGIAAWFAAGRILRKTSIAAGDAKAYDKLVVPWLSRLESVIEPPIGANLLAVAQKA